MGRVFFTCAAARGPRCSFFRWRDERHLYSEVHLDPPAAALTRAEVLWRTGAEAVAGLQEDSWAGLRQGTPEWFRLRACRVTTSNFGTVHHHNAFSKPADLLRQLLWPAQYDSCAMRYGSVNEKVALVRFKEWACRCLPHAHLPLWPSGAATGARHHVDEPGIWVGAERPYLAGSPDGVLYETLEPLPGGWYRCERSLIEIKTPYKLRVRPRGAAFYPPVGLPDGREAPIPLAYYDQIQGNMRMMGLGRCYFVVLSPTGYQVQTEPLDEAYTDASLFPALDHFFRCAGRAAPGHPPRHRTVLPALEERDGLPSEDRRPGWMPHILALSRRAREDGTPTRTSGGGGPRADAPPPPGPRLDGPRGAPPGGPACADG